jgi:broad specificity phosphatase PhoE
MFELFLIRHGQTDWNVERRVMGDKPIPLNTVGRAQARALAKGLKDIQFDAVYSSPVKRAIQTVQPILKGRDTISLFEEPGFAEINYGDWTGRLFSEITELKGYFEQPLNVPIPNGELLADVQKRAISAIENMRLKHSNGRILGISHADVIKLVVVYYLGLGFNDMNKFRIDNASLTVFHFNAVKNPRMIVANCVSDWQKYCHL